jgi:hypothetical protein
MQGGCVGEIADVATFNIKAFAAAVVSDTQLKILCMAHTQRSGNQKEADYVHGITKVYREVSIPVPLLPGKLRNRLQWPMAATKGSSRKTY